MNREETVTEARSQSKQPLLITRLVKWSVRHQTCFVSMITWGIVTFHMLKSRDSSSICSSSSSLSRSYSYQQIRTTLNSNALEITAKVAAFIERLKKVSAFSFCQRKHPGRRTAKYWRTVTKSLRPLAKHLHSFMKYWRSRLLNVTNETRTAVIKS